MDAALLTYADLRPRLDWVAAMTALRAGHRRPRAEIGDLFLGPAGETLLTRAARIEGLGAGVKSVSVTAANPARGLPSVQGAMFVFAPDTGALSAIVESRLVTEIKTAADSILGARCLARPESRSLLILGAGAVAESLVSAYPAAFPGLERIAVWTRRPEAARAFAARVESPLPLTPVTDLPRAVAEADIVSAATMAREPILEGAWVQPGTHVDLIGAFTAEMREADDALLQKARIFVDSRETTLDHIGELMIPLREGVIDRDAVLGDFYDFAVAETPARQSETEITLFKNGGGAHLDLMIADYLIGVAAERS